MRRCESTWVYNTLGRHWHCLSHQLIATHNNGTCADVSLHKSTALWDVPDNAFRSSWLENTKITGHAQVWAYMSLYKTLGRPWQCLSQELIVKHNNRTCAGVSLHESTTLWDVPDNAFRSSTITGHAQVWVYMSLQHFGTSLTMPFAAADCKTQ